MPHKKLTLLLLLLLLPLLAYGQQVQPHPLSRQDSVEIDAFLQKYQLFLDQGDRKEASRWLNETASVYWNHNYFQNAIEYFEQSLELNAGLGNENGTTMLQNNLGMLYADVEQYQKSLSFFEKTYAARKSAQEPIGIISALVNMSVVQNKLGRHNEAVKSLEESLKWARETNDVDQIRSSYGLLAETYTKAGDQANAQKYFELYRSFHELSQQMREKKSRQAVDKAQLAALQAENERQKTALELAQKQQQMQQQQLALLQYDSAQKQMLNELSRTELTLKFLEQEDANKALALQAAQEAAAAQELNLKNTRLTRNIFIIAALCILAITLLVLYLYRQKRTANQKLSLLNEEILQQKEELSAQAESLKLANEKLVELDRFKEGMIGMVVHDLKNPLNTVIVKAKSEQVTRKRQANAAHGAKPARCAEA